jgi:hypothetical protein
MADLRFAPRDAAADAAGVFDQDLIARRAPSGGHLWVGHAGEVAVEISDFLTKAFDAER